MVEHLLCKQKVRSSILLCSTVRDRPATHRRGGSFSCVTKVLVATGAATVKAFAERGASVVIGDVAEQAEKVVEEITAAGGKAIFVKTDVSNPDDAQALVQAAIDKFGGLDIAFNNAGVLPPTAPLLEQTRETWNKVMAVDVTGLIADPDMSSYVTAKHAVIGLTRAAAFDYAKSGVRVNVVDGSLGADGIAKPLLRVVVAPLAVDLELPSVRPVPVRAVFYVEGGHHAGGPRSFLHGCGSRVPGEMALDRVDGPSYLGPHGCESVSVSCGEGNRQVAVSQLPYFEASLRVGDILFNPCGVVRDGVSHGMYRRRTR